jgi:predicted ATPase/DNA-binding SARP family transcriptional activator
MPQLKLYVFGPPRVEWQERVVEVRPRKALALLVYLAVTRQPHSRDTLATLFWPESDQITARASLRRTLYRLHESVAAELLTSALDTVSIHPQIELWLDVARYQQVVEQALPAGRPAAPDDQHLASLLEAAEMYSGDFLAGFNLADCPEFDEWQFFQREGLRQSFAQILEQIANIYQGRGDYEQAVPYARRWLALDPLHEPVHRLLMKLYAWSRQQAAAVRQYQECERILSAELDAPPDDETRKLFEAIKNKQLAPPVLERQASIHQETAARRHEPAVSPASSMRWTPPHPLPAQTTPFVGRQTELAQLRRLLVDEPVCRLLTLAGQGGTGKSRLAVQLAERLAQDVDNPFADGIIYAPLAPVTAPSGIAAAIAEAIGLTFYSHTPPREQLLDHLRPRRILLILDNFEHLLEGGELLAAILAAAPAVKILLISRVGANLHEEWFYPIAGLSFPATNAPLPAGAGEYEAVQLFAQCAQRAQPQFDLAAEREQVMRICRLVEGMPLALELAATWLRTLTVHDVAEELEQSLDILTAQHQNVPERHRSMRAVMEQSWSLLNPVEQEALKRLSIFRGGFETEAAQQVAGATRLTLAALLEKALVRRADGGRYQLHELLRQFAEEQLQTEMDEYAAVQACYCAYYSGFLAQRGRELTGAQQKEALDRIAAELDNIRAAWYWAVERRDAQAVGQAAQGLWLFCHYHGALHEGEAAFGEAARALAGNASGAAGVLGLALAAQGWIQARRGEAERGRLLIEQGLELLQQAGEREHRMFARLYLGAIAQFQGRFSEAKQIGQECLDYYAAAGNDSGVAKSYELMGTSDLGNGLVAEAEQLLQKSLDICRRLGEYRLRILTMIHLGIIGIHLGEYERVRQLLHEAARLCREIHNQLSMTMILRYLARLAMKQGEYAQAVAYLESGMALCAELGIRYTAGFLRDLGLTLLLQGDLPGAERMCQRSLEESQAHNHQVHVANARCYLGRVAFARGELRQAEQLQREALATLRTFGNEPEIALALRDLGCTTSAMDKGGQVEARQYYRQALQITTAHRLAPLALDIFTGVAELWMRMGDLSPAAEVLFLVEQHSAADYESKKKAKTLLAQLEAKLSGDQLAAARAHSRRTDWQATANRLFDLLSGAQQSDLQIMVDNLPPQPTPFVGREQELAMILQHMRDPACRLLTLVGPGGIGKTRLAVQAARLVVDSQYDQGRFLHGIFFIALASVTSADGLAPAIAAAIGLDLYGNTSPKQRLLDHLRDKRMLLVLDNFEHLLDTAELAAEIVAAAPGVKLLITSREGVNLQGGWLYPVGGMSYPGRHSHSAAPVESYEAMQLFVQSARRVRFDFDLQQAQAEVMRICQLVEGMPLALELAATWLKALSVRQVTAELERGLDFLVNLHRDAPARHRSMRAVLESSWALLSAEEQETLARLSVFGGGFRRHAADAIVQAPLIVLAMLVDKSLVRVSAEGRYQLHNLLRQFAAEKLQAWPQEEEATRSRHTVYYLDFLSTRWRLLTRKEMPIALAEIAEEIDNIALAWREATAQEDVDAIAQTCKSFRLFYWVRGRSQEGYSILLQTLNQLQQSPTAAQRPGYDVAIHELLAHLALFEYFLGDYVAAEANFEQAAALARKLGGKVQLADCLVVLGAIAGRQGRQAAAEEYLGQSLTLFREAGYVDGIADVLHELAQLHVTFGNYPEAKRRAAESLALSRQIERLDWIADALDNLGWTTFCLGQYEEARRYYHESLEYFQNAGHHLGIALAIGGLGMVAWAEGEDRPEEALALMEESLSTCRRVGHRLHIASRLAHLAQAANDLGDYAQARRYGEEGLEIAFTVGAMDFANYLLCCLAESAYGLGDLVTARMYLHKAAELGVKMALRPRLAIAIYHWAVLLLKECVQADTPETIAALKRRQAAECLALVAADPASWQLFRARSQRLLEQLRPQIAAATFFAMVMSGAARTLESVAAELLEWSQEQPEGAIQLE